MSSSYLSGVSEEGDLKALLSLHVGQGGHELGPGSLGNTLQILLLTSPTFQFNKKSRKKMDD